MQLLLSAACKHHPPQQSQKSVISKGTVPSQGCRSYTGSRVVLVTTRKTPTQIQDADS